MALQVIGVAGDEPVLKAAAATDPCEPTYVTSEYPTTYPTTVLSTSAAPGGSTVTTTVNATVTAMATATTTVAPTACPIVPWLDGWRPKLGPVFNDPLGGYKAQTRIIHRVIKAINHAKKKSTIKIASYSLDRGDVLYALRKAYDRGVHVQVVVNKAVISGGTRSLQAKIGANPNKKSFVVACAGKCRKAGDGGNMHAKVYAFSRSGGAQYLMMMQSGNLTSKAVYRQWNDSYAVANDKGLWDKWSLMFKQMAHQKKTTKTRLSYTVYTHQYTWWFERSLHALSNQAITTTSELTSARYKTGLDPVVTRLKQIGCQAEDGYGKNGHTVVRIAAYAMFEVRGNALAKIIAAKKKAGCDIAVIMSVPGSGTYKMMTAAGVPVRSGDWMYAVRNPLTEDGLYGWGPLFYTHQKFMTLDGTWKGKSTKTVWTGSENWSAISFANEEVVITIHDDLDTYQKYFKHWNNLWSTNATHPIGYKPCFGPKSAPSVWSSSVKGANCKPPADLSYE
ncbi:phospholipase D-like domain-containing protein [Nocardioides sp.]|uniref:phospholipase D-like domain-containing protein n=1 Tax=Nocardioides sp. TaxID=35761 RepID=UPI0039E49274